jgi:hypothetical protein
LFDDNGTHALFSLQAANPVYFVCSVIAIAVGALKGWLTRYEWTLSAALFFIPYFTRACEMCFASFARFSAVAFPLYLVMGNILCRTRPPIAAAILALCGFVLGAYAALFAAEYRFW